MRSSIFGVQMIRETIATLPPTPEDLIVALDGRRFNRGPHRRYCLSEDAMRRWIGVRFSMYALRQQPPKFDGKVLSEEAARQLLLDARSMRLYVDLRDLSVVLVRPPRFGYVCNYAERLLAGLLAELRTAVPRPPACTSVLFS